MFAILATACVESGNEVSDVDSDQAEQQLQFAGPFRGAGSRTPSFSLYPRIASGGLFSRQFTSGPLFLCGNAQQGDGSSIDLRDDGCDFLFRDPQPNRYFARVTVDNPSQETLTYDWKLYMRSIAGNFVEVDSESGSPEPTYNLYSGGNIGLATEDCYVSVTIHTPDASRSKTATVWSGRCTRYSDALH